MAGSRTSGVTSDDSAEWAATSGTDRFAEIVEASYRELHAIACARALGIVRSPEVAEDIVQDVWVKMLSGTTFDPERGPFAAFFMTSVRHRCLTELQNRRIVPASEDMIEWAGLRYQDGTSEHEETLERIANLEAKISEALDVLKLTPSQAAMLRAMIGAESHPRSAADSGADRQARRRLRAQVEIQANLTKEERNAASLMRQHHDLAAAAAAGGIEVWKLQHRVASAERKILSLFNISGED